MAKRRRKTATFEMSGSLRMKSLEITRNGVTARMTSVELDIQYRHDKGLPPLAVNQLELAIAPPSVAPSSLSHVTCPRRKP